ncbi:hypothetical protein ACTNDY_06695 [Tissierellaceae bacterium HCP3S3_D8]
MSVIGIWDTKELDKFTEKLKGLSEDKIQTFNEDTVKEIAARTLAKIIARTPVGEYKDETVEFIAYKGGKGEEKEVEFVAHKGQEGKEETVKFTAYKDGKRKEEKVKFEAKANKVGGTLIRGWTGGKDVDPYTFIMNNSEVIKKGRTYTIIISNNVFYAPYVEYGHRTANGAGWVDGQLFVKVSEDEMQEELPSILEEKLNDFLGEYFNE